MRTFKTSYLTSSLLFVAAGVALLVWPSLSIKVVCGLFGAVILAKGLFTLWAALREQTSTLFRYWNWVFGAAASAMGVFLLVRPQTVVSVLPILVGLFVIFDGVMRIESAVSLRKAGYQRWWLFLVLALLSAGLGVMMLCNPFGTVELLVMAIGIVFVVEGVLNLGGAVYASVMLHGLKKAATHAADELERMVDKAGYTQAETQQKRIDKASSVDVAYWPADEET